MGKDYYSILGVSQSASVSAIAGAFRVKALTFHPLKQKATEDVAQANFNFAQVCEAYEVLSNCMNAAIAECFRGTKRHLRSLRRRDSQERRPQLFCEDRLPFLRKHPEDF